MEIKKDSENIKHENTESDNSELEILAPEQVKEIDHEKAAVEAVHKAEKEILYVRAEFDNYKKRLLKDQETSIKMANRGLITELLSVLDFFEHAVAHSSKLKDKGDSDVTNFVTGIEMTRSELVQLLTRFGVELIGEAGENFDPLKHEAISEIEDKEKVGNTIFSVLQKGCMLHGKLLKPARVVVVKEN